MQNVLIIQLRQLGDILLSTPVIRAIKSEWPNSKVSFLSHPMGRLILDGNPLLHQHLVMPASGVLQQAKFFIYLRQNRFSHVFDLMGNPRSALATMVTGAPVRVGVKSARDWAYTKVLPRVSGEDYIVKEKFRLLSACGLSPVDQRLMLAWGERDLTVARAWINDHQEFRDSRMRVVLSPTHRRDKRRWPARNWASLADQLVGQLGAGIVWVWGPDEEPEVRAIQSLCTVRTWIAPKTSFRELAGMIAQCELFIANSNGPSHVAVAVNTPSIQLHGPTL
ncbi:MAG: glycosyltransferase family 9 protein [Proteobacteria bacterium]|nr:glycosyltransferase family 9 protein [Pseudomonadota bacterium]